MGWDLDESHLLTIGTVDKGEGEEEETSTSRRRRKPLLAKGELKGNA